MMFPSICIPKRFNQKLRKNYRTVKELKKNQREISNVHNPLRIIDEQVHLPKEGSEIVEFLERKSIFITGGTGFVGKLLIEKLLRSCTNVEKIYLLIRDKKNIQAAARVEKMLDDVVFSELCKVQPNFRNKIVTVVGDTGSQDLGMSKKDLDILENEVDIIFHAAATVNFSEKLKVSARINVGGTQEILKLAKRCKHLASIVYVSTAYSNCPLKEIEEKFYDPPLTPEELFDLIDRYGEKLDENEKLIIGKWPNSYSFTKAIAEHTIKINAGELPICIVRPTIITATYKEPIRSWTDNYYGAIGAITNIYNGLIKTFHCDPEAIGDVVPADLVVNGIIAAAYGNYSKRNENLNIYNLISSKENPLTWHDCFELPIFYGYNFPTRHCVWYPASILTKNSYVHLFYTFLLHMIPAFITDLYQVATGRRPRTISIFKKIYKFNDNVSYFSTRDWIFSNCNAQKLYKDLCPVDQKIYNFDFSPKYLNWNEYMSTFCAGLRVYLFKDNWETLEESRKKLKRLLKIILLAYMCQVNSRFDPIIDWLWNVEVHFRTLLIEMFDYLELVKTMDLF